MTRVRLPPRPTIYELNTAVWLERLSAELGRPVRLADVPDSAWDAIAALPVDAVWLMGVWQRSPAGRQVALEDPVLVRGARAALGDLRPEDVTGSPYSVRDYTVAAGFGGPGALAAAREALAERGVGLILDFVPNHVAADHPWLTERPDCFLPGTEEELEDDPDAFVRTAAGIVAKGRDPYFPPWPDVVQLHAFAPPLRDAAIETLIEIGSQCDGVRCDMAMLMTNDVFARTWGVRAGPAPAGDYWPTVIPRVKQALPAMLFIAEAYWDMEWALQQQGFDLCYDKRLYDRLLHDPPEAVRGHLQAGHEYQERLIRFIENHDEPRAAATFGPEQHRAAAVVMSTLQGARLFHDGQLDGLRTHVPIVLGRGPQESADEELRAFYERLLRALADSGLRSGDWQLCTCAGWPENGSYRQLVAWCWEAPGSRNLVVVNLADRPAEARVRLPWADLGGRRWTLSDRLDGQRFEHDGDDLAVGGLYVALGPWGAHFLAFAS